RRYGESELNVKAWNPANAAARAAGVNGKVTSDYFGTRDTAFDPDAVVAMPAVNQRLTLGGAGVLDAARFWYANPTYDQGYALQLASGSQHESRFHATEEELRADGPVLSVTYTLPATSSPVPVEVSSSSSGVPLLLSKSGTDLTLSFQDFAGAVGGYNVYEGAIGSWYSHTGKACAQTGAPAGGRRSITLTPSAGSRYFVVTSFDLCQESISGPGQPSA